MAKPGSNIDFDDDHQAQYPWQQGNVHKSSLPKPQKPAPQHDAVVVQDSATQPYASSRVGSTELGESGYAAAREHGISQGYHLFRTPPPPEEEGMPRMGWYVNASSLKSGHAPAAYEMSDEQQLKRKKHVKVRP